MSHAVALRIESGNVPEQLADAEVFSLNMGSLLAGTKFRGEFEERIRRVLTELKSKPKPILFIDELHTIVGAGATGNGSMDAANLLKPALASGALRCMGSTTHADYKKSFEKDRALSRRFSPVDLPELPFVEEATPRGPLHVRARRLSAAHRVGHIGLLPARFARPDVLALLALDAGLAGCSPERSRGATRRYAMRGRSMLGGTLH